METRSSVRSRTNTSRALAGAMVVVAICQFTVAQGSPADIFSIPAPVIGSEPPKATDIKDGDATVSTQTGALQYSYPIQVPPGRNGVAPQLALNYSSQGSIYGTTAAGWSLSVPMISGDTSRGRLRTEAPETNVGSYTSYGADDRFVSSLAGGQRLIPSPDPMASDVWMTYRAEGDATFARYERLRQDVVPYRWRVLQTDGSVLEFGFGNLDASGCPRTDSYAPLRRSRDAFGNEISYEYAFGSGECYLSRIVYGQNSGASLGSFASIDFDVKPGNTCSGAIVGAQLDYRFGLPITTGANKVNNIIIKAYDPAAPSVAVHTRTIALGYSDVDERCPEVDQAMRAGARLLTSIQESAVGTDSPLVTLPKLTFTYGPAVADLTVGGDEDTPWTVALEDTGGPRLNLAWGYRRDQGDDRWPTVEAMMLDVDGDGLVDRVTNATVTENGVTTCRAAWQRNQSNAGTLSFASQRRLSFGTTTNFKMPMLRWQGSNDLDPNGSLQAEPGGNMLEGCALNGQVTAFHNSHPGNGMCHDQTTLCDPGTYCPDGNMCPSPGWAPSPRTYLAYRWMDMDGDGLPDLVAAVHGSTDRYDIIRGNDVPGGSPYELPLFGTVPVPGGFPSCSATPQPCKALGSTCMSAKRECDRADPLCVVRWDEANTCVALAGEDECYLHTGTFVASAGPPGTSGNGANLPPPETMVGHRQPYRMCNNLYPWFIFKNRGNGNFSDTPVIKYQPVPLESDTGDSAMTGPGIGATNQGVQDIDGDGLLDGIVSARDADQDAKPYWWYVWPNDGTGGFGPTRYIWTGRLHAAISGGGVPTSTSTFGSMGLFDLNGDGLVDHWSAPEGDYVNLDAFTNANVAFNDGVSFRVFGGSTLGEATATVKPGTDARYYDGEASGSFLQSATRVAHVRPVDVDNDGRPDMVVTTGTQGQSAKVYFNQGGQFATTGIPYPWDSGGEYNVTPGEALRQKMRGDYTNAPLLWWQAKGDLTDLDGDGIAEAVHWQPRSADPAMARMRHSLTAGPPRLMTSLSNGRGVTTTITYASMHDSSAVVQEPAVIGTDDRPKATPRTQWVVKSLVVTDSLAATSATTTYKYLDPHHGPDPDGHYAFRGFEEVQTTSPSGSKTIQRYGYAPDWSGRLTATLVVPAEAPTEVRTIDKTTWEPSVLFSGTSQQHTYYARLTEHLTCNNGQDETTCTAASAAGYTATTTTLSAFPASGQALLWAQTGSLLQAATSEGEGDRDTQTGYTLLVDATTYRLHPTSQLRQHRLNGTMNTFARSATAWDATNRYPEKQTTWFDSTDATAAVTQFEYDAATGVMTRRWKPEQYAAGGAPLVNTYDARKLFVTSETNELGQQVDHTYEYGTGTELSTSGPNVAACSTNNSCPAGSVPKEQHRIRVDGFGRTIERWETYSQDGNTYNPVEVEINTYVDSPSGPDNSVTHEVALDSNTSGTIFSKDKTELDGHGRPIHKTIYVFGSAPADQITTYHYNNDGTLHDVTTPDPSVNSAATVMYTYGFDSLGRATSIRRPDGTSPTLSSGVDITYDGLTSTSTEYVGSAGGNRATTRATKDAFGRLATVEEAIAATPAWALTRYKYGPDDNVIQIVGPAPDLVTTDLSHDFGGRRIAITRYGRTWSYGYDRNGNMTSETAPCTPMPSCAAAYTTTTAYDALDRPTSKSPAPRDLSAADIALFGLHHETFIWDYGVAFHTGNYKGRMIYWRSYANASTIAQQVYKSFDAQGQELSEQQWTNTAGYNLTRDYLQRYKLSGSLGYINYKDYVGGTTGVTTATLSYDRRGLPSSALLTRVNSGGDRTLAVQTRNVAGLVTKRRNDIGTAYNESNWTYDKLGRVTSQVVQKSPAPSEVVRQDLTYFGNDDPKTLIHTLGTSAKTFQFGYDLRHQLVSANETTTPNYFTSSYQYGTAGRLARVTIPAQSPVPAGSELMPRDVSYVYGDDDPERVTTLSTVATGLPFATYVYDLAGNQTSRCYGATTSPSCAGEETRYVYDGKNQLRRATKLTNAVVQGSEEYWYDGDGKRTLVLKRDNQGNKTELTWFIGEVEAHYDATGTATEIYSHLSLGTPVARVRRTGPTAAQLEYQFHGLASNAIAAVSESGAINASFSYTPFGEVLEATDAGGATNGTPVHRRRFNDKYQDDLTALAYFGARYYDKTLIGWTQSDPLYRFAPDAAWISPRRALLYASDVNNPLRYIDPDGRSVAAVIGRFFVAAAEGAGLSAMGTAGLVGIVAVGMAATAAAAPSYSGVNVSVTHEEAYQRAQMQLVQRQELQSQRDAISNQILNEKVDDAETTTKSSSTAQDTVGTAPNAPAQGEAAAGGPGRGGTKLNKPDPEAQGPHTTFKRDPQTGRVTSHAEWDAAGDPVKRTDVTGAAHGPVKTPHTHEFGPPNVNPATGKSYPGSEVRVRPATPDELPK